MSASTYISPSPGLTPATAFLEMVQPDLAAIEARLNEEISSEVREVNGLSGRVLTAGGKRLRPALVALSARAVRPEPDRERLTTIGAAVELVHMATLVHDDVVDDTATRRGQPTANAVFGNGVAVLTGDFLLAKAMRLLAIDGDLRVIRAVSDITIEMSEGEVMEILATGNPNISLDHYYEILHKKTAAFVEGCCRCGAIMANADPEVEATLAECGYRLGMAFQIADDLLDYTGDPEITGKPVGSDLRDGRATLPFLISISNASQADRETLLGVFGDSAMEECVVDRVVRMLERSGSFEETRRAAREHVEKAEQLLKRLPPSAARDCFEALTSYVIQRDK